MRIHVSKSPDIDKVDLFPVKHTITREGDTMIETVVIAAPDSFYTHQGPKQFRVIIEGFGNPFLFETDGPYWKRYGTKDRPD